MIYLLKTILQSYLSKGIFKGLPFFDVQNKVSSFSCQVLNNIKVYINSLTQVELNDLNVDLQFVPEQGQGIPQTFSELINNVINSKCVNNCTNMCENFDETQCGQNTDVCSWDSTNAQCKRTAEATCNAKQRDACSRDETCRFENSTFCAPNIPNCSPGQETLVNENNIAICQNCKEGYFGRDGVECNKCPIVNSDNQGFTPPILDTQLNYDDNYFRQTSVPGATACVNRSDLCGQTEYETVNIPEGALQLIQNEFRDDENADINYFKYKLSNYKTTIEIVQT